MAIYNFYFESGSRAYVLHLSNRQSMPPIMILRENTNAKDELLYLEKSVTLISYTGKVEDKVVLLSRIKAKENNIDFFYEDKESEKETQFEQEDSRVSILQNQSHIKLLDPANNKSDLDLYHIHIHYKDYDGSIKIACAPAAQTYDIVLDFGSEASQMLIHRNDSGVPTQPIDLFKGCAKHFYGIKSINPNEYDQQDNNPQLFRSIFFAKNISNKRNSQFSIANVVSKPSEDDKLISFISKRDENNKGKRIPNVKISYLVDLHPVGLNMRILYRGMVMRFIHEALCHIAEEESYNITKTFAVRLTLLVPNVMCQNDVSDFVKSIQEYVNDGLFLKDIPTNLNIAIIEVRTCSESDASLLNWINKEKHIKPGRYLIIDIGKGTTDFSVVNVKSATQAESIFRAGFIGAGNVLSYAILDNYVTHIAGVLSKNRKLLMEKLMRTEPAMLYRLEQAIENIKREKNISKDGVQSLRISDVDSIQVETIIERIERNLPLPDDYNIISDMINRIVVKEIAGRVKNLKFDYVVLSGRAFLYDPLYKEVSEDLKTIFPNIQIHYSPEEVKKGCLYGPLTPIEISKFSNMVGEPQSVNMTTVKETLDDVDARVESLKSKSIQEDSVKRNNIIKSIVNSIAKSFEHIFPDDDTSGSSVSESFVKAVKNPQAVKEQNIPKENNVPTYSINDIMKIGVPIKYYGPNTRFYISGNSYILSNNNSPNVDSDYYIYFDGEDFYLRTNDSCWPLRKDITQSKSSEFLFESLFPYSVQFLGNNADIPISKAVRR